jgi:hypothetical protein
VYFLDLLAEYGEGDTALPIIILISVVFTRVMQTMREVGRIARSGFSAADINKGLHAVLGERDVRRVELRADAVTRVARRRTLIAAIAMFVIATTLFWLVFEFFRIQVGPKEFKLIPPGGLMTLISMILFGISVALILRSPFRRPIGESLFRWVWLSPIGRSFIRISGRAAWKGGGSTQPTSRPATIPPSRVTHATPVAVVAPDRIEALEKRVIELERWRKDAG